MTSDQFRNAILLLNCIDADEFAFGLFDGEDISGDPAAMATWPDFLQDPVKFYIHASNRHRAALWAIIETRLTV